MLGIGACKSYPPTRFPKLTADELVGRLKAAKRGSRKLSDMVLMFLGWRREETELRDDATLYCTLGTATWIPPKGKALRDVELIVLKGSTTPKREARPELPSPTQNIDDALSLDRKGWTLSINTQGHCKFWPPVYPDGLGHQGWDMRWFYNASTPALAVSIGLVRGHERGWTIEPPLGWLAGGCA